MKTIGQLITVKPEIAYVVLALFFGVLFVFISPPFFVQDELHHFYRAYQISDLHIIGEKKAVDQAGGMVPRSVVEASKKLVYAPAWQERAVAWQEQLNLLGSLLHQPLRAESKQFTDFSNTVLYAPFSYLPQVGGIIIGKALQLSPLMLLYLMRLFALFCSMILIYFAIKIIPILKWNMFLLALAPLTLWEVASASYDSVTIGLSFLLIAVFFYCALTKPKISKSNMTLIFVLTVLVSLSKIVYLPLLFLYFLISPQKIGGMKLYLTNFLLLFLVNIAAILVWGVLISKIYVPFYPEGFIAQHIIDPHAQLLYLYQHPLHIFTVLENYFRVVFNNLHSYLQRFVGVWGNIDAPKMFMTDVYLLLLFTLPFFSGPQEERLEIKRKIIIGGIFLLIFFVVLLFIYLSSSVVGDSELIGMRQRYLIPFGWLFFAILHRQSLSKINLERYKACFIPIFSFAVLMMTLLTIINKYYL